MFEIFVCQQNIKQFLSQLREDRPEDEKSILRELLTKEEAKLAVLFQQRPIVKN